MAKVFGFLFKRLTDPLGLPINPLWEYLILAVLFGIAYVASYALVGMLYRDGDLHTRIGGSAVHWFVRLAIFVVLWAVTYGIIWVVQTLSLYWIIALSVAGGLAVLVTLARVAFFIYEKVVNKNAADER